MLCYPSHFLKNYSNKIQNIMNKNRCLYLCTPTFIATLLTIAKIWKQPKCPSTDEWIKKLWYIYAMEYYSA